MSMMIDIVGGVVLVGMLMFTVLTGNVNMSSESYKSASEYHTQAEAIQLSRILEFDLYKVGYDVPRPSIVAAESSHIMFKANLWDAPGNQDMVEYILGTLVTTSPNPRDKHLMRIENTTKVSISYSVTRFRLDYYNTRDSLMTSPITGAWLDSIKSIRVYLSLECPEAFDSVYSGAYYEKLIYPRNL